MFAKRYIGDGVYAHSDGYHIVLTTQEGNAVYLDSLVFSSLLKYQEDMVNYYAGIRPNPENQLPS